MKTICALFLLITFQVATLRAEPEATKDRITRDEAQHIALKQVPDGSVKSARLKRKNGHGIWDVEIAKRGSGTRTEILVDAMTGRIVSASEPAAPGEGSAKPKK